MAYSQEFVRYNFQGTMAGGNEIFNFGINCRITGATAVLPDIIVSPDMFINNLTDKLSSDEIIQKITEFWEDSDNNIPADVKLESLKISLIGTDGLYRGEPGLINLGGISGGSTFGDYIPQIAVAVTLESDKWRAPGKYNRFFLPANSVGAVDGYEFGNTQQLADNVSSLLDTLTVTPEPIADVNVLRIEPAIVTDSSKFKGEYRPVDRVSVGSIFDTQRRRRNALGEKRAYVKR